VAYCRAMPWTLETRGDVAVVVMQSNPVNKMNPPFFDDLHDAFDRLDRERPDVPVVLTAEGRTFSAGLDFEDVFPRFASKDTHAVSTWFQRFRSTILRVFASPRRTVAAVNGNAFAGGLILALACDVRIAASGPARFAINEVPVGIPMPGVYTEIVRNAVGTAAAQDAILSGRIYDLAQACTLGFVHRIVPPAHLVDEAVREAAIIGPDCFAAYAASKKALHHPTMKLIDGDAHELDAAALATVTAPSSLRAQAGALARLKAKQGA
jgi:enoyl-CoA hydratase